MVNGIFNSARASVDFNYRPGMHRIADPSMTSDRIMLGRSPGAGFGGMYLMTGTSEISTLSSPSQSKASFDSIGKIWINLIEARKLLAADVNGTSDPYAVLLFGDIQKKSRVMYHNLDPIWKEEFYFDISETNETLKIYIMDSDTIGSDDFLGLVEVPVKSIVESKNDLIDKWYKLKSTSLTTRVTGELHLQLKFLPNNARQIMSPITPMQTSWENDISNDRSNDYMEQEDDIGANFTMNTEKMLSDIHSARYLHSFMKEEFCEECLEFIYAVEQFRKMYRNRQVDPKELKKVAFVVYERFLQVGSPQEVAIPWMVREELQEFFENKLEDETGAMNILNVLTMDVFDEAHSVILHMIKSDIIPRFMYSHQYKNWSYSLDWSLQFRMMEEKRRKQSLTYLIEMMDERSLQFLKKRIIERQKKKNSSNNGNPSLLSSFDDCDSDEEGILEELNLSDFKATKFSTTTQQQQQFTPQGQPPQQQPSSSSVTDLGEFVLSL